MGNVTISVSLSQYLPRYPPLRESGRGVHPRCGQSFSDTARNMQYVAHDKRYMTSPCMHYGSQMSWRRMDPIIAMTAYVSPMRVFENQCDLVSLPT